MRLNLLASTICIFSFASAFTQPISKPNKSFSNEIGVKMDNDDFLGKGLDRYYTNGFFINYNRALPVPNNGSTLRNKILSFEAGQKIYTAKSSVITAREDVDRPFAGYLYLCSGINLLYKNESNIKLDATVGVIGPTAKGEDVQRFVHKMFGFHGVYGWTFQIQNNVTLNLSGEYNKLLFRCSFLDASITSNINLGNEFTGIGTGSLIRIGRFNQLFNSASTQSTAIRSFKTPSAHSSEFFFYYKPRINIIGYDATIEGGLFKRQANIFEVTSKPKRVVFTNEVGITYSVNRIGINIGATYSSKEVKEMEHAAQWGSITLLYRFN